VTPDPAPAPPDAPQTPDNADAPQAPTDAADQQMMADMPEMQAVRREIEEGSDTELGTLDADLLRVAAECAFTP
jgi:hypothetical protein